ncbi:MAG: MotE family protein [Sphingomonadales bacterium]
MISQTRLLPAFIVAATILFGIKVGNIWLGVEELIAVSSVRAETRTAQAQSPPAEQQVADEAAASDGEDAEEDEIPGDDMVVYTKGELELLQSLSRRRSELESRERALDMRERVIELTERRVDEKLLEIKGIENEINENLKGYDEQQKAKLARLVKVYESMKPKDAARIFDTLDLDILIPVAERMKEAKIARILSKMEGSAAKELTIELATQKKLGISGH